MRTVHFQIRRIPLALSNCHTSSLHLVTHPARMRIAASGLAAIESFGWILNVGLESKSLSWYNWAYIIKAYIKPAIRYQFEPLTTGRQPDVLDHFANPLAITRASPPLTNDATVDYYLLADKPTTSVHQIISANPLSSTYHANSAVHI